MKSHNLGQGWIANAHHDGSMVIQNVNKNEYINLSIESLETLRQILNRDYRVERLTKIRDKFSI